MFGRDKIALLAAEFLSTMALGMVTLTVIARTDFPFFLAVAGGLTVATMHYLYGVHANPAVTIGLWTMRKLQTAQAVVKVAVQMLGGLAAWQLSQYLVNADLNNIANAEFNWQVLVAEVLGALLLGWGVAAAADRVYDAARQAVSYGLSLAVGVLVASLASNALLNPAVAVGVQSWSWAYVLGPILGAVAGMSLYGALFAEQPVVLKAATARRPARTRKPVAKKAAPRKRKS